MLHDGLTSAGPVEPRTRREACLALRPDVISSMLSPKNPASSTSDSLA